MTILGIGIDILHLPRLHSLLTRTPNSIKKFTKRILSNSELNEWNKRLQSGEAAEGENISLEDVKWLAVRWTSKESIYKALYPIYKPTWKEVSIHKTLESTKPILTFQPKLNSQGPTIELLKEAKFHLSVSHDGDLPISKITNPDITRIINSDEIQSVVRVGGSQLHKRPFSQKKNPLKNKAILFRLNPYAKTQIRAELAAEKKRAAGTVKLPGHKQPLLRAGEKFLETLHQA